MVENIAALIKAFARAGALAAFTLLVAGCEDREGEAREMNPNASTENISHEAQFTRLTSLVGDWSGTNEAGREVSVSYSLTAADTVLVETWRFHNGLEALTLYHMDGARLLATHYCPIGNQPRFVLTEKTPEGRLDFTFESATNLADLGDPHGHAFTLQPLNSDTFERYETYLDQGELNTNGVVFSRVE
ncbi:MAG: hypothetical protein AAFX09_11675 [Pseudomonadota bacterium]